MLETIILAFIIAKIKGYKLKSLFKSWEIYPVLGFELMYVIMQISVFMGDYSFIKYAGIYKTLYLYSVLFLVFKYRLYISAIIGSGFIFIGTALNKIAIAANNGNMPVFPSFSYYTGYATPDSFSKIKDIHILGNETTKLKFLTDIFDVGYSILSIGDIFIRLFVFVIIYNTIKHLNETR